MDRDGWLAALRREGDAFAAAARRSDIDAPVPPCPDWTLGALVGHLGRVYHWTGHLRRGVTGPPTERPPKPPAGPAVLDWYDDALAVALDTLATVDPAAPAWNWAGAEPVAIFWHRRMAQETAVHRWDAQSAGGGGESIAPDLAVDGVDEMLDVMLPRIYAGEPRERLAGSLHLHATDVPGEWLVALSPTGATVSREHGKGDAAVRATASELLLLLYGRIGHEGLDVYGDTALLDAWAATCRF